MSFLAGAARRAHRPPDPDARRAGRRGVPHPGRRSRARRRHDGGPSEGSPISPDPDRGPGVPTPAGAFSPPAQSNSSCFSVHLSLSLGSSAHDAREDRSGRDWSARARCERRDLIPSAPTRWRCRGMDLVRAAAEERTDEPERAPTDPRRFSAIGRALRHRNYRLFFSGQSISLIGTWLTRVATSWLIYRLTGSAMLLGVLGFAGQIPTFLLAPLAGVLVDRWDRYRVLVVTQVLAMVQSGLLAALALSGVINVWHVPRAQRLPGLHQRLRHARAPVAGWCRRGGGSREDLPNAIRAQLLDGQRGAPPRPGGRRGPHRGRGGGPLLRPRRAELPRRHRLAPAHADPEAPDGGEAQARAGGDERGVRSTPPTSRPCAPCCSSWSR